MTCHPFKRQRRSIRLRGYDYSQGSAYFVTLCTHNREFLFGKIVANGEVRLNEFGQIVEEEWLRSQEIRQEIELDEWVIMPNHLHGIVIIAQDDDRGAAHGGDTNEADRRPSLQRQSHSLGSFIAGFKSSVTTRINQSRDTAGAPIWQRNYYEHIIRNERELDPIRTYIINNHWNWSADMDNPSNPPPRSRPQTIDDYLHHIGIEP